MGHHWLHREITQSAALVQTHSTASDTLKIISRDRRFHMRLSVVCLPFADKGDEDQTCTHRLSLYFSETICLFCIILTWPQSRSLNKLKYKLKPGITVWKTQSSTSSPGWHVICSPAAVKKGNSSSPLQWYSPDPVPPSALGSPWLHTLHHIKVIMAEAI